MTAHPIPLQRSLLVTFPRKLIVLFGVLLAAVAMLVAVLDGGNSEAWPAAVRGPLGSGKPVVLAFGGDVHFEGVLESKLAADPAGVLAPIAPVLDDADIAVVNLETAGTNSGAAAAKTFVFRTPPSAFTALRAGSVDVVSMANNHGMDFGEAGLRDSLAAAKRYRFPVIGIGLDGKRA